MTEKIKTGTTCIGLLFNGGVLLAADRRTTAGYIVSDRSEKVYNLSDFIIGTTSGHASSNQKVMRALKGELKLLELRAERPAKVREAAMIINSTQYALLRGEGSIVSVILGGYDESEEYALYNLGADGTIVNHEGYVADGSGSIFVKGVLDDGYSKDMSEKEALALVEKGFKASFKNDNASGGGYIARIITKDGIKEVSRKLLESKFVEEK